MKLPLLRFTKARFDIVYDIVIVLSIQISETNCDALTKRGFMSMFVSKAGQNRKTEIFKFDPVYYVPLPEIKVMPNERRILISVTKIGSIYFQKHRWGDMAVDYNIGGIAYPDFASAAI